MGRRQIGIIADTHGLIRPEALQALQGSELIIHAGDVGSPQVLEALRAIAPVVAVRGNVDREEWARALPAREVITFAGVSLCILHDLKDLNIDPAAAKFSAVISGHTHRPVIQYRQDLLLLNPGSAGPRRFHLPVSVALLYVEAGSLEPRLVELTLGDHRA